MIDVRPYLNKTVSVEIDRPLGSKHPQFGFVYELNYGFVPGTIGGDGEPIDAYVIGPVVAVQKFTGVCVAIIHRTNDDDDKLVIVTPEFLNISDNDIRKFTNFQEQYFKSVIVGGQESK